MQEKQASTQIRLEVVRAFNARFQLTPQEMNALTGGRFGTTRAQSITDATLEHNEGGAPVPLNDLFFDALQRAKTIHTDCNVLLRTKHQILG
ncbi:hypothetical protein SARC_13561 [Sphaeroforma arctica JP610]|uniref:Uncharacterized protein n=1 Tax=Sphaeroforma arctica JP610 TaxID=667725 RepID=A0A0L0FAU4_9EUKA|nr:hypothetical protein SARC_13561 [Sphaeroforma arctica JP610]KNC73880.1 hypothetical protein SARC_13561 [Sphaeroforma arctica JP610]|eukprot:XP_014147782.1 hypothetical protein SARC_13561 [Sphaeroforma arctica JP610]